MRAGVRFACGVLPAAAVAMVTAGCPHRAPDGLADDGGMAGDDAATGCRAHTLEPVALVSLDLLDGPGPYPVGTTARLRASVLVRAGCDVLGPLDVVIMPGDATDFVSVTAHVWRGSEGCGAVMVVPRIVDLRNENAFVKAVDGAVDGTAMVGWDIDFSPGPGCAPVPPGYSCQADCQCEAAEGRARCLMAGVNGGGVCALSCSEDADCAADPMMASCVTIPDSPAFVCGPEDGCTTCPTGQSCGTSMSCEPMNTMFPGAACACDTDCPTGQICGTGGTGCLSPCVTDADCERPFGCGQNGICSAKI